MNSSKVFVLAIVIGVVAAGGPPPHHHHHHHRPPPPRHFHRLLRGLFSPVIRTHPIYVSKSVGPAYAYDDHHDDHHGHDNHDHHHGHQEAPIVFSGPYVSSAPAYVKSGPTTTYVSGPSYTVSRVRVPHAHVHAHESPAPHAHVTYSEPAAPHAHVTYETPAPHAHVTYGAPAPHAHVTYETPASHAHVHSHVAPVTSVAAAPVAVLSAVEKPKSYSHSIPAAAIRHIEKIMVTKTISPVITKTTTHHTSAEPAVSVGHVQGYNHGVVVGEGKIAPVTFNTQYTTFANPTVGINGPVVYSGIAAAQPVVKTAAVAAVPATSVSVAPQPVAYKTIVSAQPAPVSYKVATPESYLVGSYDVDSHSHVVSDHHHGHHAGPSVLGVKGRAAFAYDVHK